MFVLQEAATADIDAIRALPAGWRVLVIIAIALLLHLLVRLLRLAGEWIVTPAASPTVARDLFQRRQPKVATVTTLLVSAATFSIYFVAVGLILDAVDISLTAYFASATVIALAVGFGSQGLVQDVVIGITLVFSDAFNVGDVVEISGQVGRVDRIGLRFTTLTNFQGQVVYIPNRNIGIIGRFRRGAIRAYVDIQLTESLSAADVAQLVQRIATGLRTQQPAILLAAPEVVGPFDARPGDWRYLRVKFRLWPGQGAFIETAFRQRALAALRRLDPEYADWMLTVTYRVTN
jgi:moderate conductance mechanosensitive channel